MGAAGTSSFVFPSSPVTVPETPGNRPAPAGVRDGRNVTSGAVRGIKGAWRIGKGGCEPLESYGSVEADILAFVCAWMIVMLVLRSLIWLVECA